MPRALSRFLKQPFRPATLAVVDLGSNSFRLEVGPRRGRPDLPPRHLARDDPLRRRHGREGQPHAAGAARGARVPHALPRAPVGPASVGGARGRDQHVPRREERGEVPAAGGSRARLPDRHHRRPRGGAAHLPRRRARAARVEQAAARHRHRRRLDGVHHRPPHDAGAPRVAQARLRQHVGAVLRRRRACAPTRSSPRKRTRAPRSRRSRARSAASTGTRRSRRRARRSRWRRSSRRTGCRPAASRPTASRGCASG